MLVVDDDEGVCAFIQRVLEREGHSVHVMTDGKAFAAVVGTERPDIVVTDLFMPELDGFEVMRALRHLSPGTPIIVISGGPQVLRGQALLMAERLKASAVLCKPFTAQELLRAVAKAVQR